MIYRVTRMVHCQHAEAFQLMLYKSKDNYAIWFWNARDGVTPFGTSVNMGEYTHAMNEYEPQYYGVLPPQAAYVWVSHTPDSWAEMQKRNYERFSDPHTIYGKQFVEQFPFVEDWLKVNPIEPGSPHQLSRAEYLASLGVSA